jgi:hypothetical protein
MELYPYSGDGKQFKTYISQIMRVFSGFQVETNSEGELKRVPIVYGGMNRIVASILSKDQDKFTNNIIPLMAINLVGIEPDSMGKRSPRHEDQVANLMTNGADRTFASRLIGPSFIMNFELSIYADTTSQLFEIIEQLFLLFNPRVTINLDTSVTSGSYLSEISLTSISPDIQYPLGQEKQTVMMQMSFNCPIRLKFPHNADRDLIIKKITQNMFDSADNNIGTLVVSENG